MDDHRRRPTSWPASLLPSMLLAALLAAGAVATNSSDDAPVLDMTVTTSR